VARLCPSELGLSMTEIWFRPDVRLCFARSRP
jgi:hypothetical protein